MVRSISFFRVDARHCLVKETKELPSDAKGSCDIYDSFQDTSAPILAKLEQSLERFAHLCGLKKESICGANLKRIHKWPGEETAERFEQLIQDCLAWTQIHRDHFLLLRHIKPLQASTTVKIPACPLIELQLQGLDSELRRIALLKTSIENPIKKLTFEKMATSLNILSASLDIPRYTLSLSEFLEDPCFYCQYLENIESRPTSLTDENFIYLMDCIREFGTTCSQAEETLALTVLTDAIRRIQELTVKPMDCYSFFIYTQDRPKGIKVDVAATVQGLRKFQNTFIEIHKDLMEITWSSFNRLMQALLNISDISEMEMAELLIGILAIEAKPDNVCDFEKLMEEGVLFAKLNAQILHLNHKILKLEIPDNVKALQIGAAELETAENLLSELQRIALLPLSDEKENTTLE